MLVNYIVGDFLYYIPHHKNWLYRLYLSIFQLHWLNFTPVEDHFYRRLHSECSDEALKKINKFPNRTIKLSSLDRKTFSSLVQPLLKLRQACNHPQVCTSSHA